MPLVFNIAATSVSIRRAIEIILSSVRGLKTMMPSKRLINSGRIIWLNCSLIREFLISSIGVPLIISSSMNCDPALEVAMIMLLVKSIVSPSPSVKRPSSITCKNKLKIFGLAFSNSSSKIKEKGFLRTASVK